MSTLVTLSPEDIKNRVTTTNSFSKAEMVAHRAQITDARKAKRDTLSKMDGAQLGGIAGQLMKEKGAVVTEVKTHVGSKQQTWTIRLTAKVHKSDADRLKDKARKLQDQLNKVEAELEKAKAPTA